MSDTMSQAETPTAATAPAGHAKKSSFYLAMRILPKPQREAMYEVYTFCRLVDDIADEGGPRPERHAGLNQWRADIDALYAGTLPRESLRDLQTAIRAFGLKREDFHAIIDGMDMDVTEDIRGPDWATLELYCDRVASAVGRLSVCIFGTPEAEREGLAHHLGKALQLANILRDIDEDAGIGRLYLPSEALDAAGISSRAPRAVAADPKLPEACRPVVARAEAHFAEAKTIMARCPRASVKAPRIMAEAYGEIFTKTVARGFAPPRVRVKVSKARFLMSLLRHGLV
jgi:squalene synthase HpnD